MKKVLLSLIVIVLLLVSSAALVVAAPGVTNPGALRDLAAARRATAKYHDVSVALADGYSISPFAPCVENPFGVMGFHYANTGLMDTTADILTPEILLYVNTEGGMRLVGVEYMVLDVGQSEAPIIFGQTMDGPMPGHGGGPPHYDLHVWLWQENPSGMFANFNPNVSCG